MRQVRGGPGAFGERLGRTRTVEPDPGAEAPLRLLRRVLEHQGGRAGDATVVAASALAARDADGRLAAGRFPLLDLDAVAGEVAAEAGVAVAALAGDDVVPAPLAEAGAALRRLPAGAGGELVAGWLDDPLGTDPPTGFWIGVGAAPILELAASAVTLPGRGQWSGSACPVCGGPPQVSVIAEESGEFLGGSPRSLVCARCATWWPFARATCPACHQDDSRRLLAYVEHGRDGVRVDACERCAHYVKTFDLRAAGARPVVPLVDDVATVVLDVWAAGQGLHRAVRSLAGV